MRGRCWLGVIPIAAWVALGTHLLVFRHEHQFGLEHHGLIVQLALAGVASVGAAAVLRAFLAAPAGDGPRVARSLLGGLPASGAPLPCWAALAGASATLYYGIEATEHHHHAPGLLPFAITIVLAGIATWLLRFAAYVLAGVAVAVLASCAIALATPAPARVLRDARGPSLRSALRAGDARGRAPPP